MINAAIDKVPEDYRIVLLLADVEGLSYKEIAEVIEHPLGDVMSRPAPRSKNDAEKLAPVC